jgi:hypothetical protein
LTEAGAGAAGDAACLNLLGVVCEARGQWDLAKRYYGRAIRADRQFDPAQQNMRRLYELTTFGSSARVVQVGDALTDLWLVRWTAKGAPAATRRFSDPGADDQVSDRTTDPEETLHGPDLPDRDGRAVRLMLRPGPAL